MTKEQCYVIYWEQDKNGLHDLRGFVSYDGWGNKKDEYHPVDFENANKYKTKKQAEHTLNWYKRRGGFGDFLLMRCLV